jgi:hypothetical protein
MDADLDSDPVPAIFIIDLQDHNKKLAFKKKFSAYYFLKTKSQKEVTKQ